MKAPDISLISGDGNSYTLQQFRGQKVILYFYPQDDTETCTLQACSFRDHFIEIKKTGAVLIGVSPDSTHSHKKFTSKYDLNFPILSDEDKSVMRLFGVWKKKKLFGRSYMGVIRTTFVIDERGTITHIFPNVRIKGHVENVLKAVLA